MNPDRFLRALPVALASAFVVLPGVASAVQPFAISRIDVEGLTRTDPATVLAALPFKVGQTYTDDGGTAALRALFATGLFNDVRLDVRGSALVVVVAERPFVSSIDIEGMKEFPKDTVLPALKSVGLAVGQPVSQAVLDRVEQELRQQYLSRSLYGAQVTASLLPAGPDRVRVAIKVSEGGPARITRLHIAGNKAFSESTLLSEMSLGATGVFSWISKNDRYSREKLDADLDKLRQFYLRRGYLDFDVLSPDVSISPDRQNIDINITVSEGRPYTVSGVALSGDFLGRDAEFASLITVQPGKTYDADQVKASQEAIAKRYSGYGYAFADVSITPQLDRANGLVQLTVRADPRQRVYVRRINVSGNAQTRDSVIRREMRQLEAGWYDAEKIRLSRDRIDRLGFFSDVAINTKPVPGYPDQVDLDVAVTERSTGNVNLGAGYSQTEKFSIQGSLTLDNLFGTGNLFSTELNTSKYSRSLGFRLVQPYFTQSGISRSLDVGYRTSRPFNSTATSFELATLNAAVRFGIPVSETDRVFLGIGAEQNIIGTSDTLPLAYQQYALQYGRRSTAIPLTLGWERDQRNSALAPTSGSYQRLNLELSPFSASRYARLNAQAQQYAELPAGMSLGLNAELGYGKGLGGSPYPFFKNFFGGGLGSVRAFDQGSLGRVDPTGVYLGGTRSANVNAELYVPVPGTGRDRTLRFFGFMDAGNVWGADEPITTATVRASAGVGLSWLSPVGPLSLSYGRPLRSLQGDRIQKFQFQIGTAF
ncbi:outer membrane protein assembly factor BamA [Amphibiibacter pelophylacis]|uniref:Outer membrane protein assembly factor BamA n=1 Tax=Amphibiibacter pelophylacis TaxID=1799477 RepID=A0ACC6NYX2_9BURK